MDARVVDRDAGIGRAIAGVVLLGMGLGGFVDGIVLHQLLQWHHLVTSAGYPATSLENLELNTFWDGVFHAATWVLTGLGLGLFWSSARGRHARWPTALLVGGLLLGWGLFNLLDTVNHVIGLHHINETVPPEQWWIWDVGFAVWGAAMALFGWRMVGRARHEVEAGSGAAPDAYDRSGQTRHAA